MSKHQEQNNYVFVRRLENGPLSQLILSRLRTEGVDLRVKNDNISSVYPIATLDMTLEVRQNDVERSIALLAEIEKSHIEQNTTVDFKEADLDDIEFEKNIHAREREIIESKPPILIFLLILIFIGLSFYFTAF